MLKLIEGFDQFQGQSQSGLLSALTAAGYTVSGGLAIAAGRKDNSYALEIQVSAGAAGESWSNRTNSIKQDLYGISTSQAGRSIAVGDNGAAVTSVDDAVWSPLVVGVTANMKSIRCGASGTWIAVGDNSTMVRSTDGLNFTKITLPLAGLNLRAVQDGGGRWIAVGANGAAGAVLISLDDGLTWTPAAQQGAAANLSVAYGNAQWMIGGAGGQLMHSTDGALFNLLAFGSVQPINGIAYGNGSWLATAGTEMRRSTNNGATWSTQAIDLLPGGALNTIAYADGRWVIAGDGGLAFGSTNLAGAWAPIDLAGAAGARINAVAASSGARVGWRMVGQKIGAGATLMAMLFISSAPPNTVLRRMSSNGSRVVFGFAHRSSVRGRIAAIANLLTLDWPGPITMLGVTGTVVPARDVWYYYEIVVDKGANKAYLYINNTLDITASLLVGGNTMVDFDLSFVAENGAVSRIDDFVFIDNLAPAGETIVNRIGPVQIPTRMPTADVTTQWTPAAAGPHWAQVGILPPSDESYIRSSTSGAQDLFLSGTALPAGAGGPTMPIFAVGLTVLAQKSDIDNRQLGLVVGTGGTQKEVIDTLLATSPEYSYAVFETAPGNTAWTAANIPTTPFGVAVRP